MFRASALLLLAASVAVAADPEKAPPAVVELTTVTVKDGAITRDVTVYTTQTVEVPVEQVVNGQKVTTTRKETRTVPVVTQVMVKVKDLKATGTDGKAIDAADLEKKLKAGGAVVMHYGKLSDDHRKLFKDGTVFVEQTPPTAPEPKKEK